MLTPYLSAAVDRSELLLCELEEFSPVSVIGPKPSVPHSEQRTDLLPRLNFLSWSSSTLSVAKHPLRLIVARAPLCEEVCENYWTICYLDTLDCGHQVVAFLGPETGKKRHRCLTCGKQLALPFPQRKPPQSVTQSEQKKESA